jgi:ribosome-associated toxin RatA of RatAB toxin-antitoxin module
MITHADLKSALIAIPLFSVLALPTLAADATQPHGHRGVLPSYRGAPPITPVTPTEEKQLLAKKPVFKQREAKQGGQGVAVFHVDAPPDVVWSVISDFHSYPRWIGSLKEAEVYKRQGDHIFVRMKVGAMGMSVEYFIDHHYPTEKGWGTWTLDYDRKSDLDDSVGYWRVSPLKDDPSKSRVEYSVDLKISGWVPGFIRNLLVNDGLKEATSWVRVQAEKRAKSRTASKD